MKSTSLSQKTVSTLSSSSLSRIGRPIGATQDKKEIEKKKLTQVKNEIACKFVALKKVTEKWQMYEKRTVGRDDCEN